LKFQIESCQNGQKALDFGGRMAIFDEGNRCLTEACFFAQFLLAQGALFSGPLDHAANLLGSPGQIIHRSIIRQSE